MLVATKEILQITTHTVYNTIGLEVSSTNLLFLNRRDIDSTKNYENFYKVSQLVKLDFTLFYNVRVDLYWYSTTQMGIESFPCTKQLSDG